MSGAGGRGTPSSQYNQSQWNNMIPIDPALQSNNTAAPSPYTQPYPSFPGQNYAPPQTFNAYQYPQQQHQQQQQQHHHHQHQPTPQYQPQQHQQSAARSTVTPVPANSVLDTSDLATLNDALGASGVDLRAEEESLHRATHDPNQQYRAHQDRARKLPSSFPLSTSILQSAMSTIASPHKIATPVSDESVTYLALALRARLQELITAMIEASKHRTDGQFERPAGVYEDGNPMWGLVVRSDVAKQLAALERVEREEETRIRRERKERAERGGADPIESSSNAMDTTEDGDDGTPAKKKKKKEGPGVTAKNMSEDTQKRMSNAVATQAAGLGNRYAWMNASNAGTPSKAKAKAAAAAAAASPSNTTGTGTWSRPYLSSTKSSGNGGGLSGTNGNGTGSADDLGTVVTLKDAMFVVNGERGHGGGRGAAR